MPNVKKRAVKKENTVNQSYYERLVQYINLSFLKKKPQDFSMEKRIQEFKQNLAAIFDDNLHTKKWHNIVDWLIIGLILVSTAEIFISTFDIDPKLRKILLWVDAFILVFFTIEVTLRIWVAPLVDPKYKGWKGRLKYCFSFHGFIDVISTYPFYLQWLIPFPILWLRTFRTFRVVRLFRISRYMKSWKLLENTFKEKKRELIVSMQFLIVITLILSLILYFCEHEAQPENYDNGFTSVLWAFGQYIGDPGGFSENPPITGFGKAIACLVGLLGIAIVAVPAGILGSGFTEAIEHERDDEKLRANQKKLHDIFTSVLDRPTRYQAIPPYRTFAHLQSRQGMTADDIIQTVNSTSGFRIVNLQSTIPIEKNPSDQLAVEHFPHNRSYGCFIDRGSRMTIVAPSSYVDDCTTFFAYHLAKIGGFNFISREFGDRGKLKSFYLLKEVDESTPGFKEYKKDVEKLLGREGAWSLTYLIASGANEPEYPTQIHFGTGNAKGDESIGEFVKDKETFDKFIKDFSASVKEESDVDTDTGRYHSSNNQIIFLRKFDIPVTTNNIVMRIAWSAALWNPKRLLIAKILAEKINQDLLGLPGNPDDEHMKNKLFSYKEE